MEKRYFKHIAFDHEIEVDRFIQLYGGNKWKSDPWWNRYYGKKVVGKYLVSFRGTVKEFEEICNAIDLKKKKWNNKLIWVF